MRRKALLSTKIQQYGLSFTVQLMLMMRATCWLLSSRPATDVHNAGPLAVQGGGDAADAHNFGLFAAILSGGHS